MSHTTVDSERTSVAGSIFKATEKTLEIPPKGQIFETITTYIEGQGDIEIPAGDAMVNEAGELKMQNGTTAIIGKEAYKNLQEAKKKREEMSKTSKVKAGDAR